MNTALRKRTAVVLFNLGGPDSLRSVEPFLYNLFSDPAIIALPGSLRKLVAKIIAKRRAPTARKIYASIGGRSPIFHQTLAQAKALEETFEGEQNINVFFAMRYWHPRAERVVRDVKTFNPDEIILLPLYPQYSTTTTASSLAEWEKEAKAAGLRAPTRSICCYGNTDGFVAAWIALIAPILSNAERDGPVRLLLSAHGLPENVIEAGDPYAWQVECSAKAIVKGLEARSGAGGLDFRICYQSRVGPRKWIGPATDTEIIHASREGLRLVIVPIAFVSEHSETLAELDIEYRKLAEENGCPGYYRVPALQTHGRFIEALSDMVRHPPDGPIAAAAGGRACAKEFGKCPCLEDGHV